jgi:cellulose synthase/poly-beta-1,6-N-acetylglucosamine synthase-like glycosyltransferase
MSGLEIIFWSLAACVAYTYVGYPLLLGAASKLLGGRRAVRRAPFAAPVSVVITAYNEVAHVRRRVREMLEHFGAAGLAGEVIVVSDGSTDGTAAACREAAGAADNVRVIELTQNVGKAAAMAQGCAAARHDLIVLADARQTWEPQTLPTLLESFADERVGAVSGDLVLESGDGPLGGVGLYWRYEKWIRTRESVIAAAVGVSGSISAVRKELFRAVPPGTVLDDVYWPLRVVMQGRRVIHESRARAFDRLPHNPRDEFRRKIRTLSGNYQLMARLPSSLLPWRNPVWLQFMSHKVLRLVVPWALLGMLLSSAALLGQGPLYRGLFAMQFAFYALAVGGMLESVARRVRFASAASSFLILNAAAWAAFWVWSTGRTTRSWHKTSYAPLPAQASS